MVVLKSQLCFMHLYIYKHNSCMYKREADVVVLEYFFWINTIVSATQCPCFPFADSEARDVYAPMQF